MMQEDINEMQRPERIQLLFEEIRNLQQKLSELENDNQIIQENQEEIKNLIKGGTQPDKQLKVVQNGGPGCKEVAMIMKRARMGAKHQGISSTETLNLLKEQGIERSRQSVLNILDRIEDEFPNYHLRKGDSSKPTALFYKGE